MGMAATAELGLTTASIHSIKNTRQLEAANDTASVAERGMHVYVHVHVISVAERGIHVHVMHLHVHAHIHARRPVNAT